MKAQMKNREGDIMREVSEKIYGELWNWHWKHMKTDCENGRRYWITEPAILLAKLKKEEVDLMRKVREDEKTMIAHRRGTMAKKPEEREAWRNGWRGYNTTVYKTREQWRRKLCEVRGMEKIRDTYREELP